jgi:selenide, water dikinase
VEKVVAFADGVDELSRVLLTDAQTSGGLLISCPRGAVGSLRAGLAEREGTGWEVGEIGAGPAGAIAVEA